MSETHDTATPDGLSWRQVSTWLFGALLVVAGTLIGLHVRKVQDIEDRQMDDHQTIQINTGEIKSHTAQMKLLVENSEDARQWRIRTDAQFQFLIEQLIEPHARAKRQPMPGFGRDSQTFGTTKPEH